MLVCLLNGLLPCYYYCFADRLLTSYVPVGKPTTQSASARLRPPIGSSHAQDKENSPQVAMEVDSEGNSTEEMDGVKGASA